MIQPITLDVWGDFACFSRPECKVERLTYPLPTPSAVRGILSAIYSKPNEFYWQVNKIEVLHPISYISFKRNEVKRKGDKHSFLVEDSDVRTQRQTVALRDVKYRITATICRRKGFAGTEEQLYRQAVRRIEQGKCFFQPSLGLREFVAYYALSDPHSTEQPIALDLDLGYMLYDVFDLHSFAVTKKANPQVSLFHAQLQQGVLYVPDYDDPAVQKGGNFHAEGTL